MEIRTNSFVFGITQMQQLGRSHLFQRPESMSMKQLETFMSRVQSNDNIRAEVQRCGKDNSCVVKVAARHGHKFSPASLSRWQKDHR